MRTTGGVLIERSARGLLSSPAMALRASRARRFESSRGGDSGSSAAAGFAAGMLACTIVVLVLQHMQSTTVTTAASLPGTLLPPVPPGAAGSSSTRLGRGSNGNGSLGADGGPGTASFATGSGGGDGSLTSSTSSATSFNPVTQLEGLDLDLNSLPHLFLSFGNAAYFPFVHNWAKSVQALGAPYLVAAFDDPMLGMCKREGLRCVSAKFADATYFRGDFAAFRAMGAHKVRLVLRLLEQHPRLPFVVVADSDTVWLQQPWTYFEQRPGADFFISSDCLSVETEERWKPGNTKQACGHIPGNSGIALNTGLFATRNTPASRAFLASWADMLLDKGQERDGENRGVDDQLALNLLFEKGALAGVGEDDPRTILAWNRTLRVQVLPVVLFSGGHVAFVQRSPWNAGIEPIVIHTTFQRWWESGRISRLREFGLWHIDPPGYYGLPDTTPLATFCAHCPGGVDNATAAGQHVYPSYFRAGISSRFLAYENGVLAFVAEAERRRGAEEGGGAMTLFEKNWLGLGYQLAAFRDALAAGRMLGRAVVLPQLWCWCDYDEAPDILETCLNKNADYAAPFKCPLDFLGPLHTLDDFTDQWQYRLPGFLDLPQVPASIRFSRAQVLIAEARPDPPFPPPHHLVGHGVTIWPGIRQGELMRAVEPVETVAVLELRGFVPGFLGGWDQAQVASKFDDFWSLFQRDANWCCTSWGDADEQFRYFPLATIPPLAAAWKPYQAPKLWAPDWCDQVSERHGNRAFTKLPQHPCSFAPRRGAATTIAAAAAAEAAA